MQGNIVCHSLSGAYLHCVAKLFSINAFLALENLKIIKFHFQALSERANVI